jgi:hypothetical protein
MQPGVLSYRTEFLTQLIAEAQREVSEEPKGPETNPKRV